MSVIELFLIAIGLAMDAFAVSICKGLAMEKIKSKDALIIALWFGFFQALMPVIGFLLGVGFREEITAVDHWIAFVLLAFIGLNMIREALGKKDEPADDAINFKTMLVLAVATSIDALAIGITFAFLQVNIILAVFIIGIVTFVISLAGVKIGNVFGERYKAGAEIAGGIILILLGLKILAEHLGLLFR